MNLNPSVASLSNEALLSATRELVSRSSSIEADLIEHLGEIDERKLYLERAFPSMFAFCVDELGFSEDVTCNRIAVARAGRRLPAIIEALRSGKVHLAGLRLLAPHLTEANHQYLLPEAAGKSKRAIEELVAHLAPKPPIRTSIRRLPQNPVVAWSPVPRQSLLGPSILAADTAAAAAAAAASASLAEAASSAFASAAVGTAPAPQDGDAPDPGAPLRRKARVAPLSGETFKIEFTASRQLRDKLTEAQGLLRHRVPDGDLPTILEKALDLLIVQVKKERFGIGRKVRAPAKKADAPAATPPDPSSNWRGVRDDSPPSRHIPDAIKRVVYERDGGCCAYVDENGRKCGSRDNLTFEHRSGFARTGVHSVDDICLHCEAHNQYQAEKMYGREFMDRARAGDAEKANPPRGGSSSANSPRGGSSGPPT